MQAARSVASDPRLATLAVLDHAIDADIDHGCARLDPVATDEFGAADGDAQEIGTAAVRGQIASMGVRDRDGRVLPKQKLRERAADNVRAADHQRVVACDRLVDRLDQLDAAHGRARRKRRQAHCQAPNIEGMEAIHILVGINRRDHRVGVDLRR